MAFSARDAISMAAVSMMSWLVAPRWTEAAGHLRRPPAGAGRPKRATIGVPVVAAASPSSAMSERQQLAGPLDRLGVGRRNEAGGRRSPPEGHFNFDERGHPRPNRR